jgi:stage II sporulation protein M
MTGLRKTLESYFMDAIGVVSKARLHVAVGVVIFSVSLVTGAVMHERLAGLLAYLAEFAEGLKDKGTILIILGILQKNFIAMLIMMVGGIAFGLIPMGSLAFNGALIGVAMMAGVQKGISIIIFIAAIVPHGIFELPAMFIAGGVGMRIGFMQFKRQGREPVRKRIAEGLRVLFFIVLPLLIVAAVIEGLGIALLS